MSGSLAAELLGFENGVEMDLSQLQPPSRKLNGPIDGRRFFANSPFRSGYFVVISAMCLLGILYDVEIALSHPHSLSVNTMGLWFLIGLAFAYSWLALVLNYRRLRTLHQEALLADVAEGTPLSGVLDRAAWGPLQALFYAYGGMLMMEAVINRLLIRAGM